MLAFSATLCAADPARESDGLSNSLRDAGRWQLDGVALIPPGLADRMPGGAGIDDRSAAPLDIVRHLPGYTEMSMGATWRLRTGDAGWMPGVAWLADLGSVGGAPAFRGPDFRPSLRATVQWELPRDFSIGVMPGLYRDRDDDGRHYAAGVLAVTLGKAWTPRLQSFVQLAGERLSQPSRHDDAMFDLDTGVAFTVSRTLQYNLVISRSLAGETAQQLRGGFSVSSKF